jgi:hypothetical protein
MPQANTYPTSLWVAGEYIIDEHTLPRPDEPFTLRVGWYRAEDGTRLPLTGGSDFVALSLIN